MDDHSIPQKRCTKCLKEFPETQEYFSPRKAYRNGLYSQCRLCEHSQRAKREGWTNRRHSVPRAKDGHRVCSRCRTELPLTDEFFGKDKSTKTGWSGCCKTCRGLYSNEWRTKNKEAHLEVKRAWRESNPEKVKAHKLASQKRNRASAGVRNRRYAARHPEKIRTRTLNRIARKRGAEGTYTAIDVRHIYEEQEGRCFYCGISVFFHIPKDVHVDHFVPLTRGGTNWPDNLRVSCASCNTSKGNKTVSEWRAVRGW